MTHTVVWEHQAMNEFGDFVPSTLWEPRQRPQR
jgi:hypothetical protein